MLATAFQLMAKASKSMFEGEEESVSYQVLSLVDHGSLLEYELSQMITDDIDLIEGIEEALDEMASILNEKLIGDPGVIENIPHLR